MKIEIPDFDRTDDTRAVSPVIGVILMVAITVILAAVIGAFVLDLGSQLGSTGPQSQVNIADSTNTFSDTAGGSDAFTLTHKGGDDIALSEVKVTVVNKASGNQATWTLSAGWTGATSGFATQLNGAAVASGDEFTVGDTLTIRDTTTTDEAFTAPDTEYEIKVIHQPSNSIVSSSTVTLS